MFHAIACIKWVLPNPTPPNKKSGLKETELFTLTFLAAANANSFDFPTTKFLNVNLGSKGEEPSLLNLIFLLFEDLSN